MAPPKTDKKNHAEDSGSSGREKQIPAGCKRSHPLSYHFYNGPSLNRILVFQDHVGNERGSYVFNSLISVSFWSRLIRLYNNYSMSPSWIWSDKITNERLARVGYNHFISNKGEWNNSFSKFSNRVLPPTFIFTILQRIFLNLAHYFQYDLKLRLFKQ